MDAFERNKEIYAIISERTNVPIEVIAIIHYRENTSDYIDGTFNVDIRNGDILPAYTTENESEETDGFYDSNVVDQKMGALCLILALRGEINYGE